MRTIMLAAALAAPLGLLGCATGQPQPTYGEQVSSLTADCQARGGILTPIPGASTGRAATDYGCEIRGGQSGRIPGGR